MIWATCEPADGQGERRAQSSSRDGKSHDPALNATRVIVLTAKALADDVATGLTTGADYYLTKPFSPLDLLARVDEALRL